MLAENIPLQNLPDLGGSERLLVGGSERNIPVEGGGSRSAPINIEDILARSTTPVINIDPISKPIEYDVLSMLNIEILRKLT